MPLIFIIVLVLTAGAGTVVTADNSSPGDLLYGLDQFMENVQENMPMSQSRRVNFLGRLSEERAVELANLEAIDPKTLNKEAQVRLERNQEDATNRLTASIEKLESIQVEADPADLGENDAEEPDLDSTDSISPIDGYNYTPPPIPYMPLPVYTPPLYTPLPDNSNPSQPEEPGNEPWNQGPSD